MNPGDYFSLTALCIKQFGKYLNQNFRVLIPKCKDEDWGPIIKMARYGAPTFRSNRTKPNFYVLVLVHQFGPKLRAARFELFFCLSQN
jgi:hypothetical protein